MTASLMPSKSGNITVLKMRATKLVGIVAELVGGWENRDKRVPWKVVLQRDPSSKNLWRVQDA
jgi:hypothetical protein